MATEPGTDTPSDVTDPIETSSTTSDTTAKQRTLEAYEAFTPGVSMRRSVRRFGRRQAVGAAQRRGCMAWIRSLRGGSENPGTIATYASYLNRFYDYMTRVGGVDDNPMGLVMEEMSNRSIRTRRDGTSRSAKCDRSSARSTIPSSGPSSLPS